MTDEPTLLASERANRANSSAAWTPRDALREVLRRIDAGELDLDRVWIIGTQPQNGNIVQVRAGTTHESSVAVLEVAKLDAIREWERGSQ